MLGLALLTIAQSATAQTISTPVSVFLEGGGTRHTGRVGLGATWDSTRQWRLGDGWLKLYGEASIARWRYPSADGSGHSGLTQFALIPVLRYRPEAGSSPWFAEAGIGLTLTSRRYQTPTKAFSTRFNFGDHLALGRNLGAAQQHELALRVDHFSNGGYKKPNPGATFLELRYAYRFE